MTDLGKKEKVISIAGVCSNCENRENCDFTGGIDSYVRDSKCADRISDIEITVYSCDDYGREINIVRSPPRNDQL